MLAPGLRARGSAAPLPMPIPTPAAGRVALLVALGGIAGCFGPPARSHPGPAMTLTVENHTSDEVCSISLFPTAEERGFGPNRLGARERIAAGASRLFPLNENHWNIRVKDCLGRTIYQRRDLPLGKDPVVVVTDADADALLVGGEKYAH
jgi:hypothetical protein